MSTPTVHTAVGVVAKSEAPVEPQGPRRCATT